MAMSGTRNEALKNRIQHEAICQYVDLEEAKENNAQEALVTWFACQETGHEIKPEEVRFWLNVWEQS